MRTRKGQLASVCLAIILVASLGAVTLPETGCNPKDKQTGLQDAQIVLDKLKEAQPLFVANIPAYAADIAGGVAAAQQIEDYLKANDQANALATLTGLVPVFENIVGNDIPRLTPDLQTKILTILSFADVALHALVDLLAPPPAATNAPKASLSVLDVFRSRTGELTTTKYK